MMMIMIIVGQGRRAPATATSGPRAQLTVSSNRDKR